MPVAHSAAILTIRCIESRGFAVHRGQRGLTTVEAAAGFAIVASVLAVAVPAFVRELHASRFAEPIAGLGRLSVAAVAYANARDLEEPSASEASLQAGSAGVPPAGAPSPPHGSFPPSAPLTPSTPPRGCLMADPLGTWAGPTWVALGFPSRPELDLPRPFSEGAPHAFAFGFDSAVNSGRSTFVAHAHGDLDGDDVTSTFEVRGHDIAGDPAGATVEPGMQVRAEVE